MRSFLLLFIFLIPSFLVAESDAKSLIEKHNRNMLKDLLAYMEKNPDAADRQTALQEALEAAMALQENHLVIDLLTQEIKREFEQEVVPIQKVLQMGFTASEFAGSRGMKAEIRSIYELLKSDPEIQQSPMFINVENRLLKILKRPGIGDQPDLKGIRVNGEELDLAAFKGKVVLLDFWATWCPPCMAELPTMLATYEKYHEKGFEIIGISADRNRAALTGVMKQKGITWPNLYDQEQEASLVQAFHIQAFPTLLLLDQTGTVVAINTRGEELEKAVAKLLDVNED